MNYEIDFRNEPGRPFKRVVWSTDLHLDAVDKERYLLFFELLASYESDCILIGGDISNGVISLSHLQKLHNSISKSLYYVLGNHDFYYGSIANIRGQAQELNKENPEFFYLTNNGIIPLSEKTALIGHDGWADARAGDFLNSAIMLNDYLLIEELVNLTQEERQLKLQALGTEAAEYLKGQLQTALNTYNKVLLLTHVPPFEEACLPKDAGWQPHFVGKATGEALEEVMRQHPDKQLLVLCGHSHWGNDVQILPNLRVLTGHSELGSPNVQGLIFVD